MGGLFPLFWGMNGDFQELGHYPILVFDGWPQNCHRLVDVSFSLLIYSQWVYTEDQGLVEVDASAIWLFMLCPLAMSGLCHLFFFFFEIFALLPSLLFHSLFRDFTSTCLWKADSCNGSSSITAMSTFAVRQ